ncbi:hypothetical protein NQ315_016246 [Exocentrus adspersus]|uniref:Myb/SANT-like DNA-binding domain-containing protein n=1 Tax=Exocentrus adspersus TaxID=1586481 RepID=A0AAV8VJR5_9CUCU|nr:hypothetical protein NQ315_016246 [Exocentrus adspersus]
MVTDAACKKKWLNLLRTYKATKDTRNRTGRGPVKFEYFNRLDELLDDSPSNASPHSLDVSEIETTDSQCESQSDSSINLQVETETSSFASLQLGKRKNPTAELVKIKRRYFENKVEKANEKETNRNLYLQENLRLKTEKVEISKKKLELEERKLQVLEDLKNILKEKDM